MSRFQTTMCCPGSNGKTILGLLSLKREISLRSDLGRSSALLGAVDGLRDGIKVN
jgi:hypothetical protein